MLTQTSLLELSFGVNQSIQRSMFKSRKYMMNLVWSQRFIDSNVQFRTSKIYDERRLESMIQLNVQFSKIENI